MRCLSEVRHLRVMAVPTDQRRIQVAGDWGVALSLRIARNPLRKQSEQGAATLREHRFWAWLPQDCWSTVPTASLLRTQSTGGAFGFSGAANVGERHPQTPQAPAVQTTSGW